MLSSEVKVSFYRGWTPKEKLIKPIEKHGNTKVRQDLKALKTLSMIVRISAHYQHQNCINEKIVL